MPRCSPHWRCAPGYSWSSRQCRGGQHPEQPGFESGSSALDCTGAAPSTPRHTRGDGVSGTPQVRTRAVLAGRLGQPNTAYSLTPGSRQLVTWASPGGTTDSHVDAECRVVDPADYNFTTGASATNVTVYIHGGTQPTYFADDVSLASRRTTRRDHADYPDAPRHDASLPTDCGRRRPVRCRARPHRLLQTSTRREGVEVSDVRRATTRRVRSPTPTRASGRRDVHARLRPVSQLGGYTDAQFKADIATLHGAVRGHHLGRRPDRHDQCRDSTPRRIREQIAR